MVRSLFDPLFDESANEAVRNGLPDVVIPVIELLTHLGDGATVAAIAVVLYWFSSERRRTRIYVVAVGLGALGISTGLKGVFALPRPDPALLTFAPEAYGGYTFPSAHALGSAAIFSMLAITLDVGKAWQRYFVAGLIIGVVMLSRVVHGVHYPGDVMVGAAVGLAFVAFMFWSYPQIDPEWAFGLAFVLGLAGLVLGAREHSILVVGASLGAGVAWHALKEIDARPKGAAILVLGALVLPLLFVLRSVELVGLLEGVFQYNLATLAVGYAIVTAAVIAVPFAAERLNDWRVVIWIQRHLPFRGRAVDPSLIGTERNEVGE